LAKDLTIPKRLEWLLKHRGVSQNALARLSKVSPQTVANTLRHGRVPQSKTTQKWARTLGVPGSVFTTRKLSDVELQKIVKAQGAWKGVGGTSRTTTATRKPVAKKTTTRKPAARKTTAKKATVKKAVAKKPVARKTAAKKPVARKTAAKKPVARKTVAKKPVARKAAAKKTTTTRTTTRKPVARKTAAKKPIARKTAAKKPVARKTVAKKPVARKPAARKTTTTRSAAKRPIARKTVAKKPTRTVARKTTTSRGPARGGLNGQLNGIDWSKMVTKLTKLAGHSNAQVSVTAINTLAMLRK